ncbi:hypothetical protein BGZ94_007343 [Podila epigama]|nr:hypothetical protein BGZ94_007343 [Podila epigama]
MSSDSATTGTPLQYATGPAAVNHANFSSSSTNSNGNNSSTNANTATTTTTTHANINDNTDTNTNNNNNSTNNAQGVSSSSSAASASSASAANATATTATTAATEQPKKAKRKRITTEQLEHLVGLFEKTDTPSFEIREGLAKKLGMTNREIQVWFQNRRAKANRVKINEQAALHHQQHLQMQQQQQQQQQLQQQQQHHLQHQQHHFQQQQQQQGMQSHHAHSRSASGFSPHTHPNNHVHSAPSTPLQSIPIHAPPSQTSAPHNSQESAYGYFGPNGSSPPMIMPTPIPRSNHSQAHGGRRPASLYNIGSYGHYLQTQQHQQQPYSSQKQPFHASASSGGYPYGRDRDRDRDREMRDYGSPKSLSMDIILPGGGSIPSTFGQASSHQHHQLHQSQHQHQHQHQSQSQNQHQQRSIILPPPISTQQSRSGPPPPLEEFEEYRRPRHERTMSEGHPSGYMSPASISPISPTVGGHHYNDDPSVKLESSSPPPPPSSAPLPRPSSLYSNGGGEGMHSRSNSSNGYVSSGNAGGNTNRHSTASLTAFGFRAMSLDQRPTSGVADEGEQHEGDQRFSAQPKSRRSCDDSVMYDEHQQLMRDNFNMDTRLVISEDEPRPESAIDLLAYAAAYIQESEEHKKEGSGVAAASAAATTSPAAAGIGSGSNSGTAAIEDRDMDRDRDEKRDSLGRLNVNNKRQSFHGAGYSGLSAFSGNTSVNGGGGPGMNWEGPSSATASKSASPSSSSSSLFAGSMDGSSITTNPVVVPRNRDRDTMGGDGPYTTPARRPRPVTYGGSGFLYDHHENAFIQSPPPSSSMTSYGGRSTSGSANSRRLSNRNSTDTSSLLLSRGLTRPRRSSSTAATGSMLQQQQQQQQHLHHPSSGPVLPPIMNDGRRLSPSMTSSPVFGSSRHVRHDSSQGSLGGYGNMNGNGGIHGSRDSPSSDSHLSRDSYATRPDMDDRGEVEEDGDMKMEEDDDEAEYHRLRAAKRRSGNINTFFGMSVK